MKMYSMAIDATAARLFAGMTIAALLLSALPVQFYTAQATRTAEIPSGILSSNTQVDLCHNNEGASDFSLVQAKASAIANGENDGHPETQAVHQDDIIPPFTYSYFENDIEIFVDFDGRNWNDENEDFFLNNCKTPEPAEWDLSFRKDFSGQNLGFSGEDFKFHLIGDNDVDAVIDNETSIFLNAGSYTVSEVGPDGWIPGLWTIKWSGKLCENVTGESTTITLNSDNEKFGFDICSAENQYKPGVLKIVKEVVNATTSPSAFSFTVNGGTETAFDNSGINFVDVPAGDYEIEEVAVAGYSTEYSDDCSGTIDNNESLTCTITNTYDPDVVVIPGCTDEDAINYDETATTDDGSCEYDNGGGNGDETGTIVIAKAVTDGSSTSTSFTFDPSWDDNFQLAVGASSSYELATGTYSIAETLPTGWNTPAVSCVSSLEDTETPNSLELDADETITCTFTNDEQRDGGNDEDTYIIEGYVWHDDNENDIWDGFENEQEASTTEESLTGWTVRITDGETTLSKVTDGTGYYFFEVPAGTWTITEEVQSGWKQTAPNSGSHVVTVPVVVTQSLTDRLFALVVPTAHAAVVATYGLYNFGNNEDPSVDDDSSTGGGGPGPTSSGTRVNRGGNGGDSDSTSTDIPEPQVLGEQVSVVPQGAPNAGAGGTATVNFTTLVSGLLERLRAW